MPTRAPSRSRARSRRRPAALSLAASAPPSGPAPGADQGRVLIVDDDQGLLRLVSKALAREGLSVTTADSGQAALARIEARPPELMLLDLKLTDLEAGALIQALRRRGRCPPFVIITGQGDERVAVEMMKTGALDYVVKDADFLEFLPAVVRRALAQLEKERRLKQLEKEILEISDRERHRIGQDLHDGLCQQLVAIELMTQTLQQQLAARSLPDAERLAEIGGYVREAIGQTRSLAKGLSPVTLEVEGLTTALEELAANAHRRFGVDCIFACKSPVRLEEMTVVTHLYRIAQEAVSNAIKHGRAKQISISLERISGQVLLKVKDDGIGFPATDSNPASGMGMHIMQYRAGMIGGTLRWEQGAGTTVVCAVPLAGRPHTSV